MGRLLTVTKDGVLVEEYSYSPNGSREYEMNTLKGIVGRVLSYSEEDHLLNAGTTNYQYDLDGFLIQKDEGTNISLYNYSSRGELLSVTQPDTTLIEYGHDPMGRRITKKINGLIVEKYLWQGLTRLLAIYDGTDNLLQRFEYADGRMPVSMTQDASRYYLTYDQVGTLRLIADASGNVVKRIEYDTFGSIISDSNPGFKVPFGFAGGFHDSDTGLVRFGYRDYDPNIGRWTAKDPIGFAGGDTDLYGYVLNDPVNSIDPLGLFEPVTTAAIILAAPLIADFISGFFMPEMPPLTPAGAIGISSRIALDQYIDVEAIMLKSAEIVLGLIDATWDEFIRQMDNDPFLNPQNFRLPVKKEYSWEAYPCK